MFKKRILAWVTVLTLVVSYLPSSPFSKVEEADAATPIYQDTSYSFEERAAALVAEMTLTEKASQTQGSLAAGIPRLGINQYQWWNEAIHGYSRGNGSGNPDTFTNGMSYPVSYAMGSTWDPELYYREAQQIGAEIRERAPDNNRNLTMYSPTVNLSRDPRWGRNDESYSEDPYLTGIMGASFVKGVEGKNLATGAVLDSDGFLQVVTTLKHYTANNSEANRRTSGADNVDMRTLREYYTRPYRNIIQSSDSSSLMTAYSSVDGIPVSYSSYLMDTLLRQTWGFSGYITSDCDSVSTSFKSNVHKENPQTKANYTLGEAFAQAMAHGEDLECNTGINEGTGSYYNNIAAMLGAGDTKTDKGVFTENQIDVTVHRLMTARMKLGEFDANPYKSTGAADYAAGNTTGNSSAYVGGVVGQTQARLDLADELSRNTVVMLKNAGATLPVTAANVAAATVDHGTFNVAIFGPVANSTYLGGYSSTFNLNPKVYDAAAKKVITNSAIEVGGAQYNANENFITIREGIENAFGDAFNSSDFNISFHEGFTYPTAEIPGSWMNPAPTVTEVQVAGNAFSAISLSGSNPSMLNVPGNIQDLDMAVVVVGHGSGDSDEESDRGDLVLREAQVKLIQKVRAEYPGVPLLLIMETYGPVEVKDFEGDADAILWSSFNGIRKGTGFGEIITGAANPSARTTAIWYKNTGTDIPSVYDYNLYPTGTTKGRTYMYNTAVLSYPFGYGLSYSTFGYTAATGGLLQKAGAPASAVTADDEITVNFKVENTSGPAGKEVAQVYAVSPGSSADDIPDKRLVGFKKVDLAAGQSEDVSITVKVADLAFYDETAKKYAVAEGAWTIEVSSSSDVNALQTSGTFTIASGDGTITQKPAVVTVKPNQTGDVKNPTYSGDRLTSGDVVVGERLLFNVGSQIYPNVAVAMNDESLYGATVVDNIPGQDVGVDPASVTPSAMGSGGSAARLSGKTPHIAYNAIPGGAAVSYSIVGTDRHVVTVSGEKIMAVGVGVQTIRATVSYGGESASTDFVVYVKANPAPAAIKVDGTAISEYQSSVYAYNVAVPNGAAVPAVTVDVPANSGGNFDYVITPANAVPGATTITVKDMDNNGATVLTYKIGFGRVPVGVDFKSGAPDSQIWKVLDPTTGTDRPVFGSSGLTLTTVLGASLSKTPEVTWPVYTPAKPANPKNIYLQQAYGDWTAETQIDFNGNTVRNGQQVGFIISDGEDMQNYLRVGYEQRTAAGFGGPSTTTLFYSVDQSTDGTETQMLASSSFYLPGAGTIPQDAATPSALWLKVVKAGNLFTFSYSKNHTDWTRLGDAVTGYADPRIGVFAQGGWGFTGSFGMVTAAPTTPITATFAYLTINGLPSDGSKVAAAKAALTWDRIKGANTNANNVSSQLSLPMTLEGANITWTATPAGVISTYANPAWGQWAQYSMGIITAPRFGDPDANVKLTAAIISGSESESVDFDLTVKAYNSENAYPSLWKEYEDHFIMGTFGGWNNPQQIYHYKTNSPSNDLKLDAQIGNNNTNSNSRTAYNASVAAINANAGLTAEQKEEQIEAANQNVMLADNPNSISILNSIRTWNTEHPDDKKVVRAHVLAWHGGQQPNYFFMNGFTYDNTKSFMDNDVASEATMLARLDNYINKMMERYAPYKDIIYSWDVVNEPIDDYSGQIRNMEGYQSGQWGGVFRHAELDSKPDERLAAESAWVCQAFASARKWSNYYGADWKLYINDFQDSNKPYEPKMSQTVKMLKPIYEAGNIDGYGMQGRLAYAYPTIDMLREQIELGLTVADEISISEGDIRSDFVPNPDYDPTKPSAHVRDRGTASAIDWPVGSGSWALRGSDGGNTFDTDNSPVKRNPGWPAANPGLSTDPDIMKKQADFAADWMDLLIEYKDKVIAYQWDGTSDSSTFNSNKGAHLWDSAGKEKYSFFAVIGAPNRDKLKEVVESGPAASQQTKYTASSWTAYAQAKTAAESLLAARIYDIQGVNAVKAAVPAMKDAIAALVLETGVAPQPTTFTVTYNANSGTGSVPDAASYTSGTSVTVKASTGLAKTGHEFIGWNTAADGSGTAYAPNATFAIKANTTLYAQWRAVTVTPATTYTVTYNANGGTGSVTDATNYTSGTSVTVKASTGLAKTGHEFTGWNTAADGSGTAYAPNATFAIKANTTLYAQWKVVSSGDSGSGSAGGNPSGSGSIPGGSLATGTPSASSSGSQPSTDSQPSSSSQPSTGSSTPTKAADFSDASSVSSWAVPYLDRLIASNIMNGYSNGTIAPKGNVTRAEFTKLIVTALKLTGSDGAKTFNDVSAGAWFKEFVDIASSKNLINGIGDGIFAPNNQISRQDLCVITYRALQALNVTLPAEKGVAFTDDSLIADYAKDAVYALRQMNVVSGRDTGAFDPKALATREETAKIICGILDYIAAQAPATAAQAPTADTQAPATEV